MSYPLLRTPIPKRYTPNDKWARKAKDEGYRARSVYKLQELDAKFKLLKSGMYVLDLGAAPGSWSQYAVDRVGPKGSVIAVDLKPIEPITGVKTIEADITTLDFQIQNGKVDLILSDLAPNTSGIQDVDQWKSLELSQAVVSLAERLLKPGGTFVMKVLRGADFDAFLRELKGKWKNVKTAQVAASRDRSKEMYLVVR